MKISIWHKFAYVYLYRGLELSELIKVWIINATVEHGIKKDDEVRSFSWLVFDNSHIYMGLMAAVIKKRMPSIGESAPPMSQREFGQIIGVSSQTIKRMAAKMESEGYIEMRIDNILDGTHYTLLKMPPQTPNWLLELGYAMDDINNNGDLRNRLNDELEGVQYQRGFKVLVGQIKDKLGGKPN